MTTNKVKRTGDKAAERKLLRMKARKQAKSLRKAKERELQFVHKSTEELFEIIGVGDTR
ncbi:MAG: hypothetical protein Q8O55_07305 [Dehalococcoidales bacterium]|nr:hypothetical protein [Dehalococcoidales bacterium]